MVQELKRLKYRLSRHSWVESSSIAMTQLPTPARDRQRFRALSLGFSQNCGFPSLAHWRRSSLSLSLWLPGAKSPAGASCPRLRIPGGVVPPSPSDGLLPPPVSYFFATSPSDASSSYAPSSTSDVGVRVSFPRCWGRKVTCDHLDADSSGHALTQTLAAMP